jgi:hypothetical protein
MSDTGVTTRKRTASDVGLAAFDSPVKQGKDWIQDYWDKFVTAETKKGDGEKDCVAVLTYRGEERGSITGVTGVEGHAEIHALSQFFRNVCKYDLATLRRYQALNTGKKAALQIKCTAKPCCVRCSVVLGGLGFRASKATYKNRSAMGQTQWVIHPNVATFYCVALSIAPPGLLYLSTIPNIDKA